MNDYQEEQEALDLRRRLVEDRREAEWVGDMLSVLSSREGRRCLNFVLEITGAIDYIASYDASNPYQTAHNEGRRWVGGALLGELNKVFTARPDLLIMLRTEARQRREKGNEV